MNGMRAGMSAAPSMAAARVAAGVTSPPCQEQTSSYRLVCGKLPVQARSGQPEADECSQHLLSPTVATGLMLEVGS
jgi:hypothetical protein